MKDISKFLNLGFTISGIIVFCLYLGYRFSNYILWIIIGITLSLSYLFVGLLKR